MTRGKGMGGHHSATSATVEWYTPPAVIRALGGFDLDPATGVDRPWNTATHHLTRVENGLAQVWDGRVWLNPPYTGPEQRAFMRRLAQHGRGTALIFARTETETFFETVWRRAHAVFFFEGRLHFHYPDGRRAAANAGAPSVLCAYGKDDMDALAAADLRGQFQPLILPRSVVLACFEQSWRAAIADWLRMQDGPVRLGEFYRHFANHPKTKSNVNWRAQIRKVLQEGPFRAVERGVWSAA